MILLLIAYFITGVVAIRAKSKNGADYDIFERTIVILITNFNLDNLKNLPYISSWKIIDEKTRQTILTDKFEIYIIELSKVLANNQNNSNELLDWLRFLNEPNDERVIKKMKNNIELKQASDKLETLSQDDKMRILAELRQRAIYEENTARKEGLKEGIEQGLKQASIKIAKNLLKQGLNITEIKNATGLSEAIINKIQQELNT